MENDADDARARYTIDERDLDWSVVGRDPVVDVPDVSRFFWSKRSFLRRILLVLAAMAAATVVSLGVAVADDWFFEVTPEREHSH